MRTRFALVGMLTAAALAAAAPAALAAGDDAGPATRSCGALRLTGSLPVPPAGMAVRQDVTIGADCTPRLGAVRLVPADRAEGSAAARPATAAADGAHHVSSWNEMYDCCNIRMTGLYTTSDWTTGGGRVLSASSTADEQYNHEPWNAGWSLASATHGADCTADCAVSHTEAHADFTYQGIFDPTGNWYANSHHSYVDLDADGTPTCRFDVSLRHTFVGWNWRHGCA